MSIVSLSEDEAAVLIEQETIITRGLQTFYEVGAALLKIRDHRLYRMNFATFEDYCQDRWGLKRRNAYRLIDAAVVFENVSNWTQTPPENEAQVRPLTSLPAEKQAEAWREAVETAPSGKITAAHVAATVERMTSPPPPVVVVDPEPLPAEDDAIEAAYQERPTTIEQVEPTSLRPWHPEPVLPQPSQAAQDVARTILESGRDDFIAQDFDRLVAHLIRATHIAPQVVRNVPTSKTASVLTQDEFAQLRFAVPVLEYVMGVYADYQRRNLRVVK